MKQLIGSLELNRLYQMDCTRGMKLIPNESVDLIIADPPYYKAINEKWDNQWANEQQYVEWVERWFSECVRTLKPSGSFYCYGNFDIISKLKVLVFEKDMEFNQAICLDKGIKSIAGRTSNKLKQFPTASEYLLFYTHKEKWKIRELLKKKRTDKGYTIKQMAEMIGVYSAMYGFYEQNNTCSQFPTKEKWDKICGILDIDVPYEKVAQSFRLPLGVTDVWSFSNDRVRFGHPTQKPRDICERIITASSKEGDNVLIPFGGSGSECVAARKLGRNFISFETEPKYIEITNMRLDSLGQVAASSEV